MRKQFNLQEFLKNPTLKVVTYQGEEVRIICTDGNDGEYPVVGFIGVSKDISMWSKTGKYKGSMFALHKKNIFFEDDEMSAFEKKLEMTMVSFSNSNIGSDVRKDMPKDKLHGFANRLLDLARKEILKDLPKWKKAKENRTLPDDVVKIDEVGNIKNGKVIHSDMVWKGEYFIMLQSLKSLPKEE